MVPRERCITILVLTFTTCKEDTPTEPEGSNGGNDLLSITIGMSGGELKTEEFSLIVPAGSFLNETTLSLSVSDDHPHLARIIHQKVIKLKVYLLITQNHLI